MTACRLSEGIKATWAEINLEAAEWVIPKERMKARTREHRVPLSPQVMELLRALYREEGNPYLFIGTLAGMHIAPTTVTAALRNAGRSETLHGMRAAFKTWAEERTNFPGIIAEMSLGHSVGNAVERSYRRSDLATKRRKLMEAWGKYCCTPPVAGEKKGTVLTMRGRA